jgi:hypothetical protein
MKPILSGNKKGVELEDSEIRKLKAAWPVLEQMAFHLRNGGTFNDVDVKDIDDTAGTVAALVCDLEPTTTVAKNGDATEPAKSE